VSGAGCPRVTHPFAALPSEGLPLLRFPLDLHVLGTPPAFVLSQDQTLRREPLDPAVKAGFGFVVGKSASPSSTPGSAFLWCSFVRPSSRQARRTAPPVINGVNALAFGTLFSSQGASADPKEGTPKRWGRATHHGRHVRVGRQPKGRDAAPNDSTRHDDGRGPPRSRWATFDRPPARRAKDRHLAE
jgi:hypothetical protein